MIDGEYKNFPHRPGHLDAKNTTYIITAITYTEAHYFNNYDKLKLLHDVIIKVTQENNWKLQAWSVLPNHYHIIVTSPATEVSVGNLIKEIHSKSAIGINKIDNEKGRKVWFQYWDTCLTYPKSYYARLNYVNNNPVKHGVVKNAKNYPFCSMNWMLSNADKEFLKILAGIKYDKVSIPDNFGECHME